MLPHPLPGFEVGSGLPQLIWEREAGSKQCWGMEAASGQWWVVDATSEQWEVEAIGGVAAFFDTAGSLAVDSEMEGPCEDTGGLLPGERNSRQIYYK